MKYRSWLDATVFHNTAYIIRGYRHRAYWNITKASKQRIIDWKSKTYLDWATEHRIPSVDERNK